MRFFTRQLYQDFNSSDATEADRADEAWENAIQAYRAYLKEFESMLPSSVRKLTELDLHDAEILSRTEDLTTGIGCHGNSSFSYPIWSSVAVVTVRLHDEIISLIYALWDHVRENAAPKDWPFSKNGEHWLYEELEILQETQGEYRHRILLSSGTELDIPFVGVVIHRFKLQLDAKAKKQSA